MRMITRTVVVLFAVVVVAAACQAAATPTAAPTATEQPSATASPTEAAATANPDDLLAKVLASGKLRVSSDPAYPPQSELVNGAWEGFDIDVSTEIAKRLGVTAEFSAQDWAAITAGNWGGRWDVSVGSMTITVARQAALDFSPPYYYTPAQMAASTHSGITALDGLAGKAVCVGEATTYLDWLKGTLDLVPPILAPVATPPAGVTAVTQPTDRNCAEQWQAGRFDFDGWLSSITTVDQAIADKLPLVKVGDPVFIEQLAVAVDKSGPAHAEFMLKLNEIVLSMRADGTLTTFSTKWFGVDRSSP
jgi:polar amino acid transport system substrate-binding protein